MKIVGIDGMTREQLAQELNAGAKFVIYQYCVSILIMTFKRGSNVYFIPANAKASSKGLGFTLISLLAGWWGIPWGPRSIPSPAWPRTCRAASTSPARCGTS